MNGKNFFFASSISLILEFSPMIQGPMFPTGSSFLTSMMKGPSNSKGERDKYKSHKFKEMQFQNKDLLNSPFILSHPPGFMHRKDSVQVE